LLVAHDERGVGKEAGLVERACEPGEPALPGEDRLDVAEIRDPAVAVLEESPGGAVCPAHVVEEDHVGSEIGDPPGGEHQGYPSQGFWHQVGVVRTRWDEDQSLDLSPDEIGHELAFPLKVFTGIAENYTPPVLSCDLLHPEREVAIVRISQVGDGHRR